LMLPNNTPEFDYTAFLRGKGVFLSAYEQGDYKAIKTNTMAFKYYPKLIARKICESIDRIGGKNAGFMKAMVIGDKSGIDKKLNSALINTGTSHIAVVSGMNIAFLTGFILLIFGYRIGKWVAFPAIFLFMSVVGFSPSVVRAGIMQFFILLAPLLRRETDRLTTLGAALFIILILNPFAIKDIGLLLSFGATLGIILFYDSINHALKEPAEKLPKIMKKILFPFISILSMTFAAMAFTLPLSAVYFGRFSMISPLANMLILPIFSITFSFILILGVVGIYLPAFARLLFFVPSFLFDFAVKILYWLSKFSFASVSSQNIFYIIFVIFVYFLITICVLSTNKKGVIFASLITGFILFSAAVFFTARLNGQVQKIVSLSSGYGGKCVIITYGASTVMVDCGSGKFGGNANFASDYLLRNGIQKIDMLILTSYDAFHSGAVIDLMKSIYISKMIVLSPDRSGTCHEITANAEAIDVPVYTFTGENTQVIGEIVVSMNQTNDGGALVNFPTVNGNISVVTIKNGYNMARLTKTVKFKCDILIMDKMSASNSKAMRLYFNSNLPKAVILLNRPFEDSEGILSDYNGSLFSTGENGTVTICDSVQE
ncbi:MAG: ComEC/Rec2 family competence protein, partial [Clostridiales bacterium]|nr:ComEC/Rec2 family competence protein [Clostridiales bacterium]